MKQHRNLFDVSVFSSPKIPPLDEGQIPEEHRDVVDSFSQFPMEESHVSFKSYSKLFYLQLSVNSKKIQAPMKPGHY